MKAKISKQRIEKIEGKDSTKVKKKGLNEREIKGKSK